VSKGRRFHTLARAIEPQKRDKIRLSGAGILAHGLAGHAFLAGGVEDVIGELVSPWLLTWWIVTRSPLSGSADAHKWTLEEYTALVERVEQNYAGLSTRYATGPEGKQTAQMQAAVSPEGAFVLTLIQPSGAIRRFDEASGQSVATGEAMVIVMRDHDRDGRPDDVQTTPTGEPLFEETVTPDGFTELRDAPEHAPFFVVWSGSVEALVASQVRRPPEHVVQ